MGSSFYKQHSWYICLRLENPLKSMKQSKVSGSFDHDNNHVDVQLSLIFFEEDGRYIVYSPSLDVSGYGNNEAEAKESFEETMDEFLRYTTNKNTLREVLKNLGWNIKKKNSIKSPALVQMINTNKYLAEIFEEKQYRKENKTIKMPAFA